MQMKHKTFKKQTVYDKIKQKNKMLLWQQKIYLQKY